MPGTTSDRDADSPFEEMLERNRAVGRRSFPETLSGHPARGLAIITCMDCRLTAFWEEALGIERGDAVVLRNAGNTIAANDDVLRSLVVAVHVQGVRDVVVVGHTKCGMAALDTAALLESLSESGMPRDRIPGADLREWLGQFGSVRDNVLATAEKITSSGLFPSDLRVHGLILDTLTGEAERVL